MLKKLLYILAVFVTLIVIWQYELIGYLLLQGRGQFKVLWEAQQVEEFLKSPDFPDSLKFKVRLIQEVRQYAVDSLGVNDSRNYRTLFDQKGKPILWVVTGCKPFAFEAREWEFPLFGSFAYKGFFDYDRAMQEKETVIGEGYDAGLRVASAWSTLGWFRDPILSNMLNREPGELANLIIHELTHATLFVKDSVTFNENLASFVGDVGAEMFLIHKYGENSEQYLSYLQRKEDRDHFTDHIIRGTTILESLYHSFTDQDQLPSKLDRKNETINEIMNTIDTLSLHFPRKYEKVRTGNLPNNSYFLSFIRYRGIENEFVNELEQDFKGDLRLYLEYLKKKYPSL